MRKESNGRGKGVSHGIQEMKTWPLTVDAQSNPECLVTEAYVEWVKKGMKGRKGKLKRTKRKASEMGK